MVAAVALALLTFAGPAQAAKYAGSIAPKATSEVDCNGWSPKYAPARPMMRSLCTDPIHISEQGKASRLTDNGWYVGHDEPSVKFISSTAGSGNAMVYYMQLPVDPAAPPTADGSVTDYGELSIAPWFGLPMCDGKSYPQNPCTADSDSNSGSISDPDAAGSAFMELQFYPPGFTPFLSAESCSPTQWCSALNIDSLECTFGFATCNSDCEEPVNFSYLQTNGIPPGSPAPQNPDIATWFGNAQTLKMNPGDVLKVSITDPSSGFTVRVDDLTTGQSGFMQASASNGFANTNISDCSGNPHTWHAEYSSASQQNQVPWAALEGGVLMQQEIGHFESCNSVANDDPFSVDYGSGGSFSDPGTFWNCVGGREGGDDTGEGPCTDDSCTGATTEGFGGPTACPTDDPDSGDLCEFSDAPCHAAGSRTATLNGQPVTESQPVAGCYQTQEQNGDLDFDGTAYQPDWPDGSANHPTAFKYTGPFMSGGQPYPQIQFETPIGGSEALCDTSTGQDCATPPIGSNFYPFWSLNYEQSIAGAPASNKCVWNFGNDISELTNNDFARSGEYGSPDVARYGGTLASGPTTNPATLGGCGAPTPTSNAGVTGTAEQGQPLTETHATWSNGSTDYAYQWQQCDAGGSHCTVISGASSQTYIPTAADIGHTLRVQETVPGHTGTTGRSTSAQTGLVVQAPPSNTSPPTISGTAIQGQVLTESHGTWNNNPTSFTYQWQDCDGSGNNCSNISGATGQTYTLAASDVGHRIVAVETATNSTGATAASSAATAVVAVPVPSNSSPPTISGVLLQGQVLTEKHGAWTNNPSGFGYQWEDCNAQGSDCTPILGATGQTYTLEASDIGHTIVVLETASNGTGPGNPAPSAATGAVQAFTLAPNKPSGFPAPAVSGTPRVGATLASTSGLWYATPQPTYSYQWQRCRPGCSDISGATGSTYKLASADQGAQIAVVVTATNSAGKGQSSSGSVGPIGPSTAQITRVLQLQLVPHGRNAAIGALLTNSGYSYSFRTPSAGQLVIDWWMGSIRVATRSIRVNGAGRHQIKVNLTHQGGQILTGVNKRKLKATGTFTPQGLGGTTVSRTFSVNKQG
jgi:hypothetical protein